MQILTDTHIDFLGRRHYFIGLSLVLMLAGAISLVLNNGPRLGIDFKGGTLVYVKFKEAPDVNRIRRALEDQGINVATLQPFAEEGSHELKIDLETISFTSTPEILTNDILPSIDSSNEKSIVNT